MKKVLFASLAAASIAGVASADGFIGLGDFSGGETLIDFNATEMGDLGHPTADIGSNVMVTDSGGGTAKIQVFQ